MGQTGQQLDHMCRFNINSWLIVVDRETGAQDLVKNSSLLPLIQAAATAIVTRFCGVRFKIQFVPGYVEFYVKNEKFSSFGHSRVLGFASSRQTPTA